MILPRGQVGGQEASVKELQHHCFLLYFGEDVNGGCFADTTVTNSQPSRQQQDITCTLAGLKVQRH